MIRPDRQPLAGRVEADETYVGGPRPGKPGRGAAGKTLVAGAVEAGRGEARGRRLGRLRLRHPGRRLGREPRRFPRHQRRPAGDRGDGRLARLPRPAGRGLRPRAGQSQRLRGRRHPPAARHPPRLRPRQALAPGHPPRGGGREAPPRLPRRVRLPVQPPHRHPRQPRLRPADRARGAGSGPPPIGRSSLRRHQPDGHG